MVRFFLDMDGVLADFDRGVRELCGMDPPSQRVAGDKAKDDAMWDAIREVGHFYDKLEPTPGAKEMFDRIREKYGDRCEILTGIPKEKRGIPTAAEDKANWTHRLLSAEIRVNAVHKEQKPEFCEGKDSILIDDLERNIRAWEEAGGTGILHKSAAETIKELERRGLL